MKWIKATDQTPEYNKTILIYDALIDEWQSGIYSELDGFYSDSSLHLFKYVYWAELTRPNEDAESTKAK